jgi:hypothetical protein
VADALRTEAELARVSLIANDLSAMLHNAWGAVEHRGGEIVAADFIEAATMAVAGLTAQHINPAGDVTAAKVASIQLFTHCLRVEISAAKARGALP